MGYTWHQFSWYLRLARQERARTRLERLVDTNAGFAGGTAAREVAKALRDRAQG